MDRRQKLGLLIVGAWAAFVTALTIFTHRLGVMALLGLIALLVLPFRKRPSPGPPGAPDSVHSSNDEPKHA